MLAIAVAASVPVQAPSSAEGEEAVVRAVFDAYKAALVSGDGARAAALVDRATFDYFEELKGLAMSADREQIDHRPFIDRLLVISIRHVLDPKTVADLGLAELIERAMGEGWISPATVEQLEMGRVSIEGDRATGEVLTTAMTAAAGSSSPVEGLSYSFQREQGQWRFGFSSLVSGLNQVIRQFTEQLGTDEDELIFVLVETFSGRKVMPDVWLLPESPSESSPVSSPHADPDPPGQR